MKSEKIECIGSFIIVGILLIMMIISLLFTILPKILVGLNLSNDKINKRGQYESRKNRKIYG